MNWMTGPLLGFDTETTGINVFTDRIVTAATVLVGAGEPQTTTWLIDPGVEIPAAASAVHGITTEHARAHGRAPAQALAEIANHVYAALAAGTPLVGFNVAFDLTLLESELARHGLPTLQQRLGRPLTPVIDPLVIDRGLDRYRRGKRTLEHIAAHYGVTTGDLHDASEDVRVTLGVLQAMCVKYPEITRQELSELHAWQATKHREWADGFNAWRESRGMSGPGASPQWPLQTA